MGIIAEQWLVDESVQLKVHRLTGVHRAGGAVLIGPPSGGEALLFRRCRSVHGCLMRSTLDVLFLATDGTVLRVCELRPWRARFCARAAHTLELAAGEAARLGIGHGATLKKDFEKGGYEIGARTLK